jgi:hypothetical protein
MRMLNSQTTPTNPRSTKVSAKPPSDKADRGMYGPAVGRRIVSSNVSPRRNRNHRQDPSVIRHPTAGLIVASVMSPRIPARSIAPSKQLVKPSIA